MHSFRLHWCYLTILWIVYQFACWINIWNGLQCFLYCFTKYFHKSFISPEKVMTNRNVSAIMQCLYLYNLSVMAHYTIIYVFCRLVFDVKNVKKGLDKRRKMCYYKSTSWLGFIFLRLFAKIGAMRKVMPRAAGQAF